MSIKTLIEDVYKLLETDGWFTDELAEEFSNEVARRVQSQFNEDFSKATLRLSKMGPCCPKALWASINASEEAEPLPPWARFKYTYGHLIEALAITLAKAAGHEVTGEQDELVVDGIRGHRDCVIDGCIVDVKSCSSLAFKNFKQGIFKGSYAAGYLSQLDGYLVGSAKDPLVEVKDKAYIWFIDKQLGHMCLHEHTLRKSDIHARIAQQRRIVGASVPPECECGTVPDGKSGNVRLDAEAGYSAFKHFCFPNLRTFLYADGPHYLTKVERKPDVVEVDKNGKIVYNG